MNLAKGRNGKIGRQIPGQGLQAKIVQPSGGGYHRNLYLSEGQIAQDQNYFARQEAKANAIKARRKAQIRARGEKARQIKQVQGLGVAPYQQMAKLDPMREKLRQHYAHQMTMGQSQKVAGQLYHTPTGATSGYYPKPRPPADFSNSGANMHLIPGVEPRGTVVWHSDYRQHLFKGNPLTRDGVYGPRVTDYDRFVNGVDVNQSVVAGAEMPIAGNTMLGFYQGPSKATNFGKPPSKIRGRKRRRRAMGDDEVDFDYFDDAAPDDVDFSYFDDVAPDAPVDDLSYLDEPDSFWDTPEEDIDINTIDEDFADATPEQPGFFDKLWTAAEVQSTKTLSAALQQQMLNTLASGGKVGTKGGTVVLSPPGQPPQVIRHAISAPISKTVIYASVGLAAVGLLLFFMKSRRRTAAA